jgi:hypothetical protein
MMASRTGCDAYVQVTVVVVRPSCSTKVVEITASLEASLERVSDTLLMRDLAIRRLVNH